MIATYLRKVIYPAIALLLIPLALAPVRAQAAQSAAPVAKYTGADAYSSPTWTQADTNKTNNPYYLGPLKSEKFFYNYDASKKEFAIPGNDAATTYQFGILGCGAKKPGSTTQYLYPAGTLCIVVWNYAASTDGSDLQNFLESTLTDQQHQYLMVFCNETEIHQTMTGCMCDPSGTIEPCMNSAPDDFITQFEVYSKYITHFEQMAGVSNVHMAEISAASSYSKTGFGCNFLVPTQYVSSYLIDVYEKDSTGVNLSNNTGWSRWVNCTSLLGDITRGIAEYGIDCGHEASSGKTTKATFEADEKYLRPFDLLVWNLWDFGGCTISTTHESGAVKAWRAIEGAS
jgi:hypothetical protein